jgi:hypothetical protein
VEFETGTSVLMVYRFGFPDTLATMSIAVGVTWSDV